MSSERAHKIDSNESINNLNINAKALEKFQFQNYQGGITTADEITSKQQTKKGHQSVYEKEPKTSFLKIKYFVWILHDLVLIPTLVLYCALVLVGVWFNSLTSLKIILGVESIFVVLLLFEYTVFVVLSIRSSSKNIFTYTTFALLISIIFWIIEFATLTSRDHTF